MNLRSLEAFCAVYEEGGFTAAAQRLRLSQPTVSSHVASLERELSVRVFDRLGRETRATPTAHVLYRHARPLLDLAREMAADLDRFLHGMEGLLRVGGSTIPGEYWLPTRIGAFHKLYPRTDIRLEIHGTGQIVDRIRDGSLEIGIVGAVTEDKQLVFRSLGMDRLVMVAPPKTGWTARAELTLDDLRTARFVLREPGSGTRQRFEEALATLGGSLADLTVVAELGSTTAVKEAVKAGLGLSVLSRLAVQTDLQAGLLREVAVPGLGGMERSFAAVFHAQRALSPLVEAFLNFLLGDAPG